MNTEKLSKIWAALCYIPPVFAVLVYVKRRDRLVFFHAKQALGVWLLFTLGFLLALLPGRFFAVAKWPVSLTALILAAFLLICGCIDACLGKEVRRLPFGKYVDGLPLFTKLQAK